MSAQNTTYATIQMRRGKESEMDTSKFLPSEFGSTTDSKKLFFAFGAGDVKQISTVEDMQHEIDLKTEEIINEITQDVNYAISSANSAAEYANSKGNSAQEQAQAAESAANAANSVVEDLLDRMENGEFDGPQGPQGPQGVPGQDGQNGANGVVVTIDGQFAMQIMDDGHLYVIYPDDGAAPDMEISNTGHLLWNY